MKEEYENVSMNTSPEDIVSKVERVRKAFRNHKTLPIEYRLDQLRKLYYAVHDNQELLKRAVQRDFNKNPRETQIMEIQNCLHEIDTCINNIYKWTKEEKTSFAGMLFLTAKTTIQKTPLGTILMISPWNYPYMLSIVAIADAIAAGNTVVWKPSEVIPFTSQATTMVLEQYLDPDVFQVVNGGVPETTLLLEQKFDKILFTGSGKIGKIVAEAAAKHMTPTILELGGKSPVFISKNIDLNVAAKRIMWGKFANAGQTCIAPDYVLIERGAEDEFVAACERAVNEFYPNISKDTEDFSHIPNDRGFDRLVDLLARTKGKVVLGGNSDKESRYIEPTIVKDITADDSLMEDELFGPILPIISVDNLEDEGVNFVLDEHDTPLALYVFSNSQKQIDEILSKTRSGDVTVNDVLLHCACNTIPFGGIGTSGHGAYHGKHGFDAFSHKRGVVKQPFWAEALSKMRYPPYNESKSKAIARMTEPTPWYGRSGPVKRSIIARLLGTKVFWVGIFAALAYKLKINRLLSK